MIRLYFVRHGETEWNKIGKFQGSADVSLNDIGKIQADLTAEYIKKFKFDKIYSSPLKRAFETASKIAEKQNIGIIKDERLKEMNFGDWEGLSFDCIEAKWPGRLKEMYYSPDKVNIPNGETFLQVQMRTKNFLNNLLEIEGDKNYLIVSHGVTLRTIFCNLLGIPLNKAWNLSQKNANISCIEYRDKNRSILNFLNYTDHLSKVKE